jgi:MFS family permease
MSDSRRGPTPPRPTGARYRYVVLAMLILVYTLNFLDRQILGILAKPIKEEFGLTDGQFGLMSGLAFALLYTTLAIPIAWLADRFSRVWIMTTALTLWSGFTALCGFAGGFSAAVPGPDGRRASARRAGWPRPIRCWPTISPSISGPAPWRPTPSASRWARRPGPWWAACWPCISAGARRSSWWALVGVLAPVFRLVVRDPRRGGADMAAGDTTTVQAPAAPLGEVVRVLAPSPASGCCRSGRPRRRSAATAWPCGCRRSSCAAWA